MFVAVARFDFSWGDPDYHQETLENLKAAIKTTKKLCAVSFSLAVSVAKKCDFFNCFLLVHLLIYK